MFRFHTTSDYQYRSKVTFFLPVEFPHVHDNIHGEDNSLDRLTKLENIHLCIMQAMKTLRDKALSGIQISTSDEEKLILHAVIWSYSSYILQQKCMECAKYSNLLRQSFPICNAVVEVLKTIQTLQRVHWRKHGII